MREAAVNLNQFRYLYLVPPEPKSEALISWLCDSKKKTPSTFDRKSERIVEKLAHFIPVFKIHVQNDDPEGL